jgi:hypothetical protein
MENDDEDSPVELEADFKEKGKRRQSNATSRQPHCRKAKRMIDNNELPTQDLIDDFINENGGKFDGRVGTPPQVRHEVKSKLQVSFNFQSSFHTLERDVKPTAKPAIKTKTKAKPATKQSKVDEIASSSRKRPYTEDD